MTTSTLGSVACISSRALCMWPGNHWIDMCLSLDRVKGRWNEKLSRTPPLFVRSDPIHRVFCGTTARMRSLRTKAAGDLTDGDLTDLVPGN